MPAVVARVLFLIDSTKVNGPYRDPIMTDRLCGQTAGGSLPLEAAANITTHIALGLAKAHERKIIHRDTGLP